MRRQFRASPIDPRRAGENGLRWRPIRKQPSHPPNSQSSLSTRASSLMRQTVCRVKPGLFSDESDTYRLLAEQLRTLLNCSRVKLGLRSM